MLERYRGVDANRLHELLAISTDFKERQQIRGALRELQGVKLEGDTVVALSFGADTVKRLAAAPKRNSPRTSPDRKPWNQPTPQRSPRSPRSPHSPRSPSRKLGQYDKIRGFPKSCNGELSREEVNRQRRFRTYLYAGSLRQDIKKDSIVRRISAIKVLRKESKLGDTNSKVALNQSVNSEFAEEGNSHRPTSLSLSRNHSDSDLQHFSENHKKFVSKQRHLPPSTSSPLSPISATISRIQLERERSGKCRNDSVLSGIDSPVASPRTETIRTAGLRRNLSDNTLSSRTSLSSVSNEDMIEMRSPQSMSAQEMRESDSEEETVPVARKRKVLLSRKQRVEKSATHVARHGRRTNPDETNEPVLGSVEPSLAEVKTRQAENGVRTVSRHHSHPERSKSVPKNRPSRTPVLPDFLDDVWDEINKKAEGRSKPSREVDVNKNVRREGRREESNKETKSSAEVVRGRKESREVIRLHRSSSEASAHRDLDTDYQERERCLQAWRERRERRYRTSDTSDRDLKSSQSVENLTRPVVSQAGSSAGSRQTSGSQRNGADSLGITSLLQDKPPRSGKGSASPARILVRSLRRSQSDYARPRPSSEPRPTSDRPQGRENQTTQSGSAGQVKLEAEVGTPSPRAASRVIEKLVQMEAELQEALRRCTNFNERRKIRAEVRQLRDKRTVLEGSTEAQPASVVQRSASVTAGETTPEPEVFQQLPFQYGPGTSIEELRRQLSETKDYEEKRKIRLALRQLRQQPRDASSENGRPVVGVQRSQSCIETSRKSSDTDRPVAGIETTGSGPSVSRSHSVADTPSQTRATPDTEGDQSKRERFDRTRDRGTDIGPRKHSRHSSSDNIDCDTSKTHSNDTHIVNGYSGLHDTETGSPTVASKITVSHQDHKSVFQPVESSESRLPIRKASSLESLNNSHQTVESESPLQSLSESKSRHKSETIISQQSDENQSPETTLDRKISRYSFRRIKDKDPLHSSPSLTKDEISYDSKSALKENLSSNLARRRHEEHEKSRETTLTPTDEWLENKKKSSPTPCELNKLMSSMDIAAAFSEILDAVENPPSPGVSSVPSTPDSVIPEEDSSGEGTSKTEVTSGSSGIKVECVQSPRVVSSVQMKENSDGLTSTGNSVHQDSKGDNSVDVKLKVGPTEVTDGVSTDVSNQTQSNGEPQSSAISKSEQDTKQTDVKVRSTLSLDLSPVPGKNGAISVIQGDDGSVTVQEVKQVEVGDSTVTEWKKLRRSQSKTEERETSTTVEKRIKSPGGSSSVYEKDVTKTKRKITSRGSDYFQKNNYNIKRLRDPEGKELVQQEIIAETDNVSVTKGESWGDKSEVKLTLNKGDNPFIPTLTVDAIPSTIEEDKEDTSSVPIRSKPLTPVSHQGRHSKASSGYGSVSGSDDEEKKDDVIEMTRNGRPSDYRRCSLGSFDLGQFSVDLAGCQTPIRGPNPARGWRICCPEITSTLNDISTGEGDTAIFECVVLSNPLPTVMWYKGDNPVTESDRHAFHFDGVSGTASLTIEAADPDDMGQYRCVFYNPLGQAETQADLEVRHEACGPPTFVSKMEDIDTMEGHSIILKYTVADTDSVSWYKDGIIQRHSADFKQTFDGSTASLQIGEVFLDDHGTYTCVLHNKNGDTRCSCCVTVAECESENEVVPMFLRKPESQIVDEEDTVILEGDVIGSPEPIITWTRDGVALVEDARHKMSYDGRVNRMILKQAGMKDNGKYECVAENSAGRISVDCMLVVKAKTGLPVIKKSLTDITVDSGKSAVLECCIVGNPTPQILWRKNGRIIGQMLDFKQTYVDGLARLQIDGACTQDSGCYECVASSEEGEISCFGCLTVQDSPKPEVKAEPEEEKVIRTSTVQKFPSGFTPQVDEAKKQNAKSQASKVMLVRASSLRSLRRDKNDSQAIQGESDPSASQKSLTNKSEKEEVTLQAAATEDQDSVKDKVSTVSAVESSKAKQTSQFTIQLQPKVDIETPKGSDKVKELDHNENDISSKSSSVSIQLNQQSSSPSPKVVSVTDAPAIDSEKEQVKEKSTDSGSKRSKVLADLQSMCSTLEAKAEDKPGPRFKAGLGVRRTQSVKETGGGNGGSGKPEWLQVKLRKTNSPAVADTEKRESSPVPNDTTPSPAVKKEATVARSHSARLVFEKKADTPLPQSPLCANNNSSVQKQSDQSAAPAPSKDAIKLTPVSERAKMFQSSNTSPEKTPISIIAKAINLSRSGSLKTPAGMRTYGAQRSHSVKVKSDDPSNAGVTLDLTPAGSQQGEKTDLGVAQRTKLWESGPGSDKMSKYANINDEEELHKLLNNSDNFEERKKIRSRMREIREVKEREMEAKRLQREKDTEDAIRRRHAMADEEKQKKLEAFKVQASEHSLQQPKHLDFQEKQLKDKMKSADEEKQRKLEAFDRMARHEAVSSTSTVHTETKDGKSVTTRKVESVSRTGGHGGMSYGKPAEQTAQQLAKQLISLSSPSVAGSVSVKTESWSSTDGVTHKSDKTESWGAKPASAMNAFKKMDAQQNPQAAGARTNPLVAYTYAKKAATTMRRNAVTIKQDILRFCQENLKEYEKVEVTNFSTSWNDGLAFCALIHHFYPESFSFDTLDAKNRRSNFELAFDTAEKYADIAPLLDVEDMVKMKKPDWKCVFTYVQSFYRKLQNHDRNRAQ